MRDPGRAIRTRVGRAIRRLRLLRGLSQERLAEIAGSSGKHLGAIERGDANVTLDILGRIAAALTVDPGDLFSEPRGRRAAATLVITRDQIDAIVAITNVVKRARAPRSGRGSR